MTKLSPETPSNIQPSMFDDSDSELLFCQQERLDQNSPELWPEQIPGVTEFTASSLFASPLQPVLNSTIERVTDPALEKEDLEMLQEFGSLNVTQIMEKFQSLKQQVYVLGQEEAREMTRGKFLNILGKTKKKKKVK